MIKENALVEKRNIFNEIKLNEMSLQELRFFSIYLSKINARDLSTRVVSFSVESFRQIMEIGQAKISHLKETTDNLLCKIVSIPLEDGGYESFQLFKRCKVYRNKAYNNEWWIDIDAHDQALGLLFDFKTNYFKYKLWNILRLKSVNQFRMYELLKQYENIGCKTITVSKLREYLNIEPNEYLRWERFRIKVLDSCQKALEEHTDIKYTYETIKQGQGGKITALKFFIEGNEGYKAPLTFDEFVSTSLNISAKSDLSEKSQYTLGYCREAKEESEELFYNYKNETLSSFADACEKEFNEEQMQVLYNYLIKIIPGSGDMFVDRYDFLKKHYDNMCCRDKDLKLGKINNRFKYLSAILENEYKSRI